MEIRLGTLADVRTLLDWAAAEGWDPGLHDAEAFVAADPGGFLLGWLEGQPIAGISLVRYSSTWAFLGLYIVRPESRGRGHGLAMWRAAMARREGRSVGLDGVVERQPDYARSGFVLVRRNIRFAGRAPLADPTPDGPVPLGAQEVPFADIQRIDRASFPADRPAFLRAWLGLPGHAGLVATDEDGRPAGLGVVRQAREGWKVGPLFAPDERTADRLLCGLAGRLPRGDAIFLDVPEPNRAALRLAEAHAMSPVFETARMVAGRPPAEPVERIFGVTTFELG